MAELVNIASASAEYQAHFERPYIGFIASDRPRVVESVVNALLPFNFRLSHSEVVNTGTLADQRMNFRIPDRGIALSLTAEEFRFTKDGADWKTAEEDVEILVAAEHAAIGESSARVSSCSINVAMHLQALTKPREEILSSFIPEPFRALVKSRSASSYGNHLKFPDGDVLLDFSTVLANGIFIRFSSQFGGHPPINEMLTRVRNEQLALFELLRLKERNE